MLPKWFLFHKVASLEKESMEPRVPLIKPRTLSREEEVELAQSNKKVKDWHHAGFPERSNDQSGENPPPTDSSEHSNATNTSFRDKLVGAIPGAYAKAFDFADQMDEDLSSNDEDVEAHDLNQ